MNENMDIDITMNIKNEIKSNDVLLFMKGTPAFPMCGFSASVVQILNNMGVKFNSINVLDNEKMREGIKNYSNWPTIPQLYVKEEFIGGCDIVKEMNDSGELLELFNTKGDTSQILIELLERRLDAIVYRMKFVPTIFAARQLVNHGHVKVNGKRVNIPSYTVKDGDEISLKDQSKQINLIQESIVSQEREIPEYLEVDVKEFKGRFLRAPLIHDVPYPVTMEPNLVIEFYSG